MTRPPEKLETINQTIITQNNMKLVLPIIIQNYKTYFITKEKLVGLQNIITIYNKEINHVPSKK